LEQLVGLLDEGRPLVEDGLNLVGEGRNLLYFDELL
jgi:hypothetical protein